MAIEDFELPPLDEQDTLLAGLARLVRLRGADPLLANPLLLPHAEHFPDRVRPRGDAVGKLLQRLMACAGLTSLGVQVDIDQGLVALVDDEGREGNLENAVAWFSGIRDGACHFGVDQRELTNAKGLIGTLGHEVAHAYRDHHGLVVTTRLTEERLTDLTAVYLGFGVFLLESSYQFLSGHTNPEGQLMLYEVRQRGYMSPGQLAFLLGAQLVVRNYGPEQLREVREALAPELAKLVERAHRSLLPGRASLLATLALPKESEWPPLLTVAEAMASTETDRVRVNDLAGERELAERSRRVAFRVVGRVGVMGAIYGFGFGAVLGAIATPQGKGMLLLGIPTALIGYWIGRRSQRHVCSACSRAVRPADPRCANCELPLVGDIATVEERLDAEERYQAARGGGTAPKPGRQF